MSRSFKAASSKAHGRLLAAVVVSALGAALLGAAIPAASAAPPIVINGDFETGTLEGWTQTDQGGGAAPWVVYSRKEAEEFPNQGQISLPPSGEHAAVTPNTSGTVDTTYLYQDVVLPPASSDQLSMYLFYRSAVPIAVPNPDTLVVSGAETAQPNQQVRVDVLKPNAPIESVSPNDILATVYASKVGDPTELAPTVITTDLSAFAGQTVRLRVADAVQDGAMVAGIDGVSITSSPLPQPPAAGPPTPSPSNAFVRGRLTLNQKNGTGSLTVSVPAAGALTASDARRQLAIASLVRRRGGKPNPILIRTATVDAAGAGTITVPIKPTPAGRKLLTERGKIAFKVELTFTPAGGDAATQPYAGKLHKRLRPAPR